ncbi:hypothetical protein [Persicobacter sp. CCB-QB2]|uniref:hypothetical protein n=1 Tax=Persicobacter sp. CCB-QB2 TaxID=1561025 RepID=UPI0012F8323F|nr:hypothetical protein [Persicobacter sp. CCB-QB2]
MKRSLLICLLLMTVPFISFAEGEGPVVEEEKSQIQRAAEQASKGMTIPIGKNSYFKYGLGVQTWFRAGEMNPGSINSNTDQPATNFQDFAMRRLRMLAYTNIENKYFFWTQIGITSHSPYDKVQAPIFVHDFWGKIRLGQTDNFIGAGQHMFMGLSRLSLVSYWRTTSLDNPSFNFPQVNVNDDFIRMMGVFFQGMTGRFKYMASINQPFQPSSSSRLNTRAEIAEGVANGDYKEGTAYNLRTSELSYNAYLEWHFFSKEKPGFSPFNTMSHLGQNGRFLNIGAGFRYDGSNMGYIEKGVANPTADDIKTHSSLALATDVFYEEPMAKGAVLNVYAAWYNYDYGPNYVNTIGVMNPGALDPNASIGTPQGAGISQYYVGTGNVGYLNVAYILPFTIGELGRLQPFTALQYKDFEALNDASTQWDFGAHWLLAGHNVKLSMAYSTRPIYDEGLNWVDSKGLFITQMQFRF